MTHLNNEAAQLLQPSMRTVSPELRNIQGPASCCCLISLSSSCPEPRTILKVWQNWSKRSCTSLATDNKHSGYNTSLHLLLFCYSPASLLFHWSVYWNGSDTIKVLLMLSAWPVHGQAHYGHSGGAAVSSQMLEADWRRGTSGYYLLLWLQIGP